MKKKRRAAAARVDQVGASHVDSNDVIIVLFFAFLGLQFGGPWLKYGLVVWAVAFISAWFQKQLLDDILLLDRTQ
eukprot:3851383-Rhodomonas_salina.1